MAKPSPTTDRTEAARRFEAGVCCLETGNTHGAQQAFESSLQLDPSLAEARFNLALLALRRGEPATAHALLLECCRQRPEMAEAHAALGGFLLHAGEHAAALASLQHALTLSPGYPVALNNLGLCLLALDRPAEAEAAFREALATVPGHPDITCNLGSALHVQDLNLEAAQCLSELLKIHPQHERARLNLALALLSAGRYKEAWPHLEARKRLALAGSERRFEGTPWNGSESLEGRSLLVYAEQGLGDSLQFSRFLPRLAELGTRVHLELQAPLLPLFTGLPVLEGLHEVGKPNPACEFHVALASLPLLLGITADNLPPPNPGLLPDSGLETFWATQAPKPKGTPRIGLVWSGSSLHSNDRRRSLPVELLADALRGLPYRFVSLQMGASEGDLRLLSEAVPLLDLAPNVRNFSDSAALLSHIDLLVSVDTAWAHLAGLLGKPVWLLLTQPSEWRWSPALPAPGWYPSARLFRQPGPGDWAGALKTLCQALQGLPSQG